MQTKGLSRTCAGQPLFPMIASDAALLSSRNACANAVDGVAAEIHAFGGFIHRKSHDIIVFDELSLLKHASADARRAIGGNIGLQLQVEGAELVAQCVDLRVKRFDILFAAVTERIFKLALFQTKFVGVFFDDLAAVSCFCQNITSGRSPNQRA